MAKEPTIGKIEQLTQGKSIFGDNPPPANLVPLKSPTATSSKLRELEKRVAALEEQLPEKQSASKVDDAYTRNSCGCILKTVTHSCSKHGVPKSVPLL